MFKFLNNFFGLEEYKNDAILKEQWLEHFFMIPFEKPKKMTRLDYINYLEELNHNFLNYVILQTGKMKQNISDDFYTFESILCPMGKSTSIISFSLKKFPQEYNRILRFINSNKNSYFMLIRFPNLRKEDLENPPPIVMTRDIDKREKRCYKFSPLESAQIQEMCRNIEKTLYVLTKTEKSQSQNLGIIGLDEEVIIYDFSDLQYFSYPLSKRAELYSKYPKLHDKIFKINFKEFAKSIIDKENDSDAMKRNADRTRKILKKIGVSTSYFRSDFNLY